MSKGFTPTPHPVLAVPSPAQARALGERAWRETMARREQIIAEERLDPFRSMWEPSIWQVADAIMGYPWVDAQWAEQMRKRLGFDKPCPVTLVLGGNRGGKSEWASSRVMRTLRIGTGGSRAKRAWALHSTMPMSIQYQQPLFWKFMPAELRQNPVKGQTTYVAYKQKTGFSEQSFVLPPTSAGQSGADCLFKTYDQDIGSIEGGNLDIIWPDELVPPDWIETMELRIAERNGWMPVTFTPVQGYSETVRLFLDGAEVVQESVGYLLPKDGGPPDVARALGFDDQTASGLNAAVTPEEMLEELWKAEREGRAALYPQCIPQKCEQWLDLLMPQGQRAEAARGGPGTGQPRVPKGREFEMVPRVMKCADEEGKRAVVFFHSADNPFGNPKNVYATIASKAREFIRERFYGVAHKTLSARFPKFNRNIHCVPPEAVPKEGTNYLYADPCNGRNFFMSWFRVTPNQVFLYREWPSGYYIPGVGVPGPWALPDGRHPDGKRGPAQKGFGWGLRQYKRELARLEGWKMPKTPEPASTEDGREQIDEWTDDGSKEQVQERFLDSRFASTPRVEKDRPVTLMTELEEIGLFFTPTPGDDIDEGVSLISDALYYDESKEVGFLNQPRLLVSTDCVNTIYALQTWTGMTREGRRCLDGATKDPIDLLRYYFLSDAGYLGSGAGSANGEEEEEAESDFVAKPKTHY